MNKAILNNAMQILAARDHSSYELKQKLQRNGHAEEEIEEIILHLQGLNYLNDQRFAENYIRSKASRHMGRNRIQQELRQKGVSQPLITEGLQNLELDFFALAYDTKCGKFGPAPAPDYQQKSKQMRYLQYRGYNFDEIRFAVEHQAEQE